MSLTYGCVFFGNEMSSIFSFPCPPFLYVFIAIGKEMMRDRISECVKVQGSVGVISHTVGCLFQHRFRLESEPRLGTSALSGRQRGSHLIWTVSVCYRHVKKKNRTVSWTKLESQQCVKNTAWGISVSKYCLFSVLNCPWMHYWCYNECKCTISGEQQY